MIRSLSSVLPREKRTTVSKNSYEQKYSTVNNYEIRVCNLYAVNKENSKYLKQ